MPSAATVKSPISVVLILLISLSLETRGTQSSEGLNGKVRAHENSAKNSNHESTDREISPKLRKVPQSVIKNATLVLRDIACKRKNHHLRKLSFRYDRTYNSKIQQRRDD
jgi:hypothetical protein